MGLAPKVFERIMCLRMSRDEYSMLGDRRSATYLVASRMGSQFAPEKHIFLSLGVPDAHSRRRLYRQVHSFEIYASHAIALCLMPLDLVVRVSFYAVRMIRLLTIVYKGDSEYESIMTARMTFRVLSTLFEIFNVLSLEVLVVAATLHGLTSDPFRGLEALNWLSNKLASIPNHLIDDGLNEQRSGKGGNSSAASGTEDMTLFSPVNRKTRVSLLRRVWRMFKESAHPDVAPLSLFRTEHHYIVEPTESKRESRSPHGEYQWKEYPTQEKAIAAYASDRA